MLQGSTLAVFVVAALALLLVPGPSVLYIVTRSIDQGRMAGLVSSWGVGVGSLVHIAGAALGISALLMSSAAAFNIVKYLGAAYLVYLGLRKLLVREELQSSDLQEHTKLPRIFFQGVLVNVLNPKTALFFFAFFPQFVDPSRGSVDTQILLLGCVFVLLGICSDGLYALLAGTLGHWLRGDPRFIRAQRYFAGSVYIALGVGTALSGSQKSK